MAGHRKFSEIRDKTASGDEFEHERRRAAARRKLDIELEAYDATLAQLRRARGVTQQQLAKTLEMTQPQVSKVEHRADVLLSTLRSYVEALGGELAVVARFPDQDDVEVTFSELLGSAER